MTTFTRLHITPLTADLLPIVLGPNLYKLAQHVSYQASQTFPENSYGFVDLPEADAKKLVLKLNGAILKGRTMKLEEARPAKRPHKQDLEDVVEPSAGTRTSKRVKRSKKDIDLLDGHELENGRKVKRGWTDPSITKPASGKSKPTKDKSDKSAKHQLTSKYTTKEELLFRTNLPSNRKSLDPSTTPSKGKPVGSSPTLVHEFEKTTIQPRFLREPKASTRNATEFVDGLGWIDQHGELIEEETSAVKKSKKRHNVGLWIDSSATRNLIETGKVDAPARQNEESGRSNSTVREDQLDRSPIIEPGSPSADDTSSSGGSSASSQNGDTLTPVGDDQNLHPEREAPEAPMTPPSVHPLEALFKRPKDPNAGDLAKPSLEIETTFSFFDRKDLDNEDDEALPPMPMTPFTSHDINQRNQRSAAPTPDTAHPSRFTSFAAALTARGDRQYSSDLNEPSESGVPPSASNSGAPADRPQSEFEKRFWAERGQNNRAWKARTRAARKEQRQSENRQRRP